MPECCVLCFFQDAIENLRKTGQIIEITSLRSEMGNHPVYRFTDSALPCAIGHPGVGAPLVTGFLEEVIALGARKFIVCGGAGTIESAHSIGKLLAPISAVRDEGTSYHYLAPSREVAPTPGALDAVKATLAERKIPFTLAKTWTTDGFYRETRGKIDQRKEEECECVEMEAAALFAAARFREVELAEILYAGDDLTGEFWDSRGWETKFEIRSDLLNLAVAACLKMS
jgi:uridine phosphorylase